MKKIFKGLLVVLFSFFTLVASPLAASQRIEYDWGTKLGVGSNYLYYDDTIKVADGYVAVSINDQNLGTIRKLSTDGKVIWETESTDGLYLGVVELGDYYYTLGYDSYYYNHFVEKISKDDGKVVMSANYSDIYGYDGEIYVINNNLYLSIGSYYSDTPIDTYYKINPTTLEKSNVSDAEYETILKEMKLYDVFYSSYQPNYDTLLHYILYELLGDTLTANQMNNMGLAISNIYDDDKNSVYVVGDFIYGEMSYGNYFSVSSKVSKINTIERPSTYCDDFDYKQGFILKFHYDDAFIDELYEDIIRQQKSIPSSIAASGSSSDEIKKYFKLEWYKQAEKGTSYFDVSGVKDQFVVVSSYKDDNCSPIGESHDSETVTGDLRLYDTEGNMIETHDLAKDLGVARVDINHVFATDEGEVYGQAFGYDEAGNLNTYVYKYMPKTADVVVPETLDSTYIYMINFGIGFIGLAMALILSHKKNSVHTI